MIIVQSESSEYPILLDRESSKSTVYKRYDVVEKQRENEDGTTQIYYSYTEEQYSKEEWQLRSLKIAGQMATKQTIISGGASKEQMEALYEIYDDWKPGIEYKTDDLITDEGKFYKILAPGHTSQADWKPKDVPALYTPITTPGEVEEWGTRDLTNNPFMIGEQVRFEGQIWESTIDNNSWSPTGYPQGWQLV